MKVCAVIVSFNGVKWLNQCLKSLSNSSIKIDIIVIDNDSNDNSVELIKSNFPEVRLLDSRNNYGFGKANNIALDMILNEDYEYALLLNQDAWVNTDVVEKLIEIHKKNPEFGILSPMHLNGAGNSLDYRFSLTCNAVDCPELISDILLNKAKDIYKISFVNAAIWLLPISTVRKVGLFDPIFPHYGEDVDYVTRLKYHKLFVGIAPHILGFHDRENRAASVERDRVMRRLKYLCILKDVNFSLPGVFFSLAYVFVQNAGRACTKLKFKEVFYDVSYLARYTVQINQILKARRISKKNGAFISVR